VCDTSKLEGLLVQLDSMRKIVPRSVDEVKINQYHVLLDALEIASGQNLSPFRISEIEINPRLLQAGPEKVYSNKKYCDVSYFMLQLEALYHFFWELLHPKDKSQKNAAEDEI
jgi:hypothetical protein